MKAWHFLRDDGLLHDGKKPPRNGVWLKHDGPLVLCASGLHASVGAADALHYAPGAIVCRVECGGEIVKGDDKIVCSRRRILWRADATETLRKFARLCALDVIDKWYAPEVVVRYLKTGDESLWAAANAAAWGAARAAADAAQNRRLTRMLNALGRGRP